MKTRKIIVQIGAHVGNTSNDKVFSISDSASKLILVEPVPYLFTKLKENYKKKFLNTSHITFVNKAISNYNGKMEMTIPSSKNNFNNFPYWADQLASFDPDHISKHLPELLTEKIMVDVITLDNLLKENNIIKIDELYLDTEGHEFNILNNFSFSVKPKKIFFEYNHIDGTYSVRNNFNLLMDKLTKMRYVITEKTNTDIEVMLFE
jgi:FkbM family methyltransferase